MKKFDTLKSNFFNKKRQRKNSIFAFLFVLLCGTLTAQMVHPGLSHKKSDLDRMKYMVEAQIEPYYSSYQNMLTFPTANYNYEVQGNTSLTTLYRDAPRTNLAIFESDSRAAYYNALRWYIEGDERHARKAVECLNAWTGLTYIQHNGTTALTSNVVIIMLEAAELIKNTYDGWTEGEIQAFKDMLVYPGYSDSEIPENLAQQGTWYWRAHQFDAVRAGNQELCAIRTTMALGIFLDNEKIYDRAWRYVNKMEGRTDDIPFPTGPHIRTAVLDDQNQYRISYSIEVQDTEPNYYGNGALENYVYENGQCQESSRDQGHTVFGLGLLASVGEIAWNQGDNLWGALDDRILLGLEYTLKYNVSFENSFEDQPEPWEPTIASGEFFERDDATLRSRALAICPFIDTNPDRLTRGQYYNENTWELPVAHYVGRGLKTEEEALWTVRARDISIEENGRFETGPTGGAYVGFGGLSFRRIAGCYGDPINGIDASGTPIYAMHDLSAPIEAENFDYFVLSGEGKTYTDTSAGNASGAYRPDENVDIRTATQGDYAVEQIDTGEELVYTVGVPIDGTYEIAIDYAALAAGGTIKFQFAGEDKTTDVAIPFDTADTENWQTLVVSSEVELTQGVQPMKVIFNGASAAFDLNSISVTLASIACRTPQTIEDEVVAGISYKYYEGAWTAIPDFNLYNPVDIGVATSISTEPALATENFGLSFGGYISVVDEGDYTFYLTSQDGSKLYIDGVEVVDNDGVHAATEASGDICLNAGSHLVEVHYFSSTSENSLDLQYDGPNIEKTAVDGFTTIPLLKNIPGLMEAEDYTDFGGVRIEDSQDGENQQQIGFVRDGYYLIFDTEVATSDIYRASIRIASAGIGGDFVIKNGDDVLGSVFIERTGSWNNWTTIELPNVRLEEGYQRLTYEFLGDAGFLYNINWISFENDVYEIPTRLQAEFYTNQEGVEVITSTDEDDGQQVTAVNNGDSISYDLNVAEATTYQAEFRVASEIDGSSIDILSGDTVVGPIDIPATGSNADWETFTTLVPLEAGLQTLTFNFNGTAGETLFDLNWIEFNNVVTIPSLLEAEDYSAQVGITVEETTDTEGLQQITDIESGDSISFNVDVVEANTYRTGFRVATVGDGNTILVKNGDTVISEIVIPSTNIPSEWQTIVAEMDLEAGIQTLTFEFETSADSTLQVNWIDFNELPQLPGLIQAEDYSSQTGTTTVETDDVDGEEHVVFAAAGNEITFNALVTATNIFKAEFRVATAGEGNTMLVKSDGETIAEIAIPNTGALTTWQTVNTTLELEEGRQALTFEYAGDQVYATHLNWVEVKELPVIPGRVEAEDFLTQVGIQTQATSDSGGGEHVGFIENGDYLSYQINVETAGTYAVSYRASSNGSGGFIAIRQGENVLSETEIAVTGNWNTWVTTTDAVSLEAGLQTIQFDFVGETGYLFNLNWMEFELDNTLSTPDLTTQPGILLYPNPTVNELTLTNSEGATVEIYDGLGRVLLNISKVSESQVISTKDLAQGIYFVRIKKDGEETVKKIIKN